MIVGTKTFSLSSIAPYNWSVSSSNSCAVPTPSFGVEDTDTLVLTFEFESQVCFNC